MTNPHPTPVLIVDDDQLVRIALRLVIDAEPDLTVVGEAVDGNEALAAASNLEAGVVLMDVRMPGQDGISATRELLNQPNPPAVLVLTTFDSDDVLLDALRAGALGFVLKDTPPAQLVDAVRAVAQGRPALSPHATTQLIRAATKPRPVNAHLAVRDAARTRLDALTERELETAALVAEGLNNTEIAARLSISIATVKAHVGALFAKLGVQNRVQVTLLVRDSQDGDGV